MQNGQITGIKIIKMNKLDFGVDDPFEGEEKKYKTLEVNISQCLSTVVEIQVPEDFDEEKPRIAGAAIPLGSIFSNVFSQNSNS